LLEKEIKVSDLGKQIRNDKFFIPQSLASSGLTLYPNPLNSSIKNKTDIVNPIGCQVKHRQNAINIFEKLNRI
jgi:hypothetical protein